MATIEDIKKVLEEEIKPLRSKLFFIEEKFDTLQKLVGFTSAKYDELLKLIQGGNEKVVTLTSDVKNLKRDFIGTQKRELELTKDMEGRAQYLRRDCIEMSGLKPTESMSCIELVKALDMHVDLKDDDYRLHIQYQGLTSQPMKRSS